MKKLFAAAAVSLTASPAFAHHPLAGAPMETFTQGVLSGIGHPVLGFDHLFFVIAVGLAAMYMGRALIAPLGYVAGMLAGVALILNGIALPAVELVIALSLLIVGGLVARGRDMSLMVGMALFGALGLFHGWAFGETLAGQEGGAATGVIAGYLLGLAAVQWLIAVAAGWVAQRLMSVDLSEAIGPRIAGGAVAGIGAFLVLESAEAAVFAALGLG